MRAAGERRYPNSPGYVNGSATSEAAANSILPKLGALHQAVYRFIRNSGGCTDEQGATALAMNPSTYRPRRIELTLHGYVCESARPGRTKSGRPAVVWEVTEKGRQ